MKAVFLCLKCTKIWKFIYILMQFIPHLVIYGFNRGKFLYNLHNRYLIFTFNI